MESNLYHVLWYHIVISPIKGHSKRRIPLISGGFYFPCFFPMIIGISVSYISSVNILDELMLSALKTIFPVAQNNKVH